jgi:dipeptidyl aminopeptidase/acylaminoacyl peptidase
VIFTVQTFVDYPNYFVSGADFAHPKQVTDANPQQADYAWGRNILIEFKNSKGERLQATLTLPANYESGKRYPMLVYFYEKMTQNQHVYSAPVYDDRPHFSLYASDGYLVLRPDIVYTMGRPGDSAVDCVTNAVKRVIELGYADPAHIAAQGHSWGGYETSFMVTQTDIFACIVTGAPPTDLVSFYDELYKSTGTVQQGITEVGQVRMGTNPWDNHALFESQSAIFNAPKIKTPFLILHGTDDGAVDWHQGLMFYNAARRLGKEVILLSYPGEGHHLTKIENQKDFLVRMKQFFDHYCKGTAAPAWMTDGVPFLKKPQPSPAGEQGEQGAPPSVPPRRPGPPPQQ